MKPAPGLTVRVSGAPSPYLLVCRGRPDGARAAIGAALWPARLPWRRAFVWSVRGRSAREAAAPPPAGREREEEGRARWEREGEGEGEGGRGREGGRRAGRTPRAPRFLHGPRAPDAQRLQQGGITASAREVFGLIQARQPRNPNLPLEECPKPLPQPSDWEQTGNRPVTAVLCSGLGLRGGLIPTPPWGKRGPWLPATLPTAQPRSTDWGLQCSEGTDTHLLPWGVQFQSRACPTLATRPHPS